MKFYFPLILLLIFSCKSCHKRAFQATASFRDNPRYRIMFWNVENLFDIYNDSLTNDDEFTPEGIRRWGYYRYKQKITNIYKVFIAAGNPYPPEIIGLCEVENRKVLLDLSFHSPFSRFGYEIVHRDSRDRRGIDVAVLYNPRDVKILHEEFITPYYNDDLPAQTRDIVYLKAIVHQSDTLHLFFNHWPSKYGGAGYTEPSRKAAAETLRKFIECLQVKYTNPMIIIGGDFNDTPDAESIRRVLRADCLGDTHKEPDQLYNLSCEALPGTAKYKGIWSVIDQFVVSGNVLQREGKGRFPAAGFSIFAPEFLLVRDPVYSGVKPFRTYEGMRYSGGYSDHLPVILELY